MFMPNLTNLKVWGWPEFKGWESTSAETDQDEEDSGNQISSSPAPSLKELTIGDCPTMKSLLSLPSLDTLAIWGWASGGPIFRNGCIPPNLASLRLTIDLVKEEEEEESQRYNDHPIVKSESQLQVLIPTSFLGKLQNLSIRKWRGSRLFMTQQLEANEEEDQVLDKENVVFSAFSTPAPSLKELEIEQRPNLRQLPHLPDLTKLEVWDSLKFEGWRSTLTEMEDEAEEHAGGIQISSTALTLKKLTIGRCPNMEQLPHLPAFEELSIKQWMGSTLFMTQLLANEEDQVGDNNNVVLNPAPSLKRLNIDECPDMEQLPYLPRLEELRLSTGRAGSKELPDWLWNLNQISSLTITSCYDLISMAGQWQHFTSLKELKIEYCSKLELLSFVKDHEAAEEEEEEERNINISGNRGSGTTSTSNNFEKHHLMADDQRHFPTTTLTLHHLMAEDSTSSFLEDHVFDLPSLEESLEISYCTNLKTLPSSWVEGLTSNHHRVSQGNRAR